MFRAIGCLVVVLAAAAAGWFLRGHFGPDRRALPDSLAWEVPGERGASRARSRVESLGRSGAPAYVSVSPADFASHIFSSEGGRLPASAHDVGAVIEGGRMVLRARVQAADLGDLSVLGSLVSILRDTVQLRIGGTFRVVEPGLGEFRVEQLRIQDISVPGPLIPLIVGRFGNDRPDAVAANGIPFTLPDHVADIRISGEELLVYRRDR